MKKLLILIYLLFLSVISNAQISFNTGNAKLDENLSRINVNAKLDFGTFKSGLNLSYNISKKKIDYLSISLKMEPAEIYITLELSKLSGRSVDNVIEIYKVHKDKGWGYIAKQLGIKPGSPEFHKLKANAKNKGSKGKSKSNQGKTKKK